MEYLTRIIVVIFISVGLIPSTGLAKTKGDLLAAYVVLGQAPSKKITGLARVVISSDASCSDLKFDWKTDAGKKVKAVERTNPNPKTFQIKVCETLYNQTSKQHVELGKKQKLELPKINLSPNDIAIIGDTGCKGKSKQDCSSESAWPFKYFSKTLAKDKPDLLLHMGDYNYRGTPGSIKLNGGKVSVYDAGDNDIKQCTSTTGWTYYSQNNPDLSKAKPDNWPDWQADLFKPAKKLMAKAPWVVLRGNHELCSRAGPGWFYFLDPNSNLLQPGSELACPADQSTKSKSPYRFSPTYQLNFENDLSLIIADNANACDATPVSVEPFKSVFEQQSKDIDQLAGSSGKGSTWLLIHRPVWAVKGKNNQVDEVINQTMEYYLYQDPSLPRSNLANVDLILSGHRHLFESINFTNDNDRPIQLVLGNGGVALASPPPVPANQPVVLDGKQAYIWGSDDFGFMTIQRNLPGKGWSGSLTGEKNHTLATCQPPTTTAMKPVCVPTVQ